MEACTVSQPPDTRESLLVRLADPANRQAWEEFVAIYRPVVFRLARQRGLQDADAHDLSQQVLLSVSKAIGRWKPAGEGAKFRHWLARVARNAILNAIVRGPKEKGCGGTTALRSLQEQPDESDSAAQVELEYKRALFRRAACLVRDVVEAESWQAFWLTTVEGKSVDEAAKALDKSPGAVYAARMRVMRRLQVKVRELED